MASMNEFFLAKLVQAPPPSPCYSNNLTSLYIMVYI